MAIAVTGARGFIGSNLLAHLREKGYAEVRAITHDADDATMEAALRDVRFVFHLAGVNRPQEQSEFSQGNDGFTRRLAAALQRCGARVPVAYASSIQAEMDNPYGRSKRQAEQVLLDHGHAIGSPTFLLRLPNVFGKWSRPFYNSAVATFCHQVANGLPLTIHDPTSPVRLVYVDDLCMALLGLLDGAPCPADHLVRVQPEYRSTVGELAATIQGFRDSRGSLVTLPVGTGLARALYATYVSHLPEKDFSYAVPRHADARGVFVEMLKTPDCGQFSYFTAYPGVTRGEHYHHTKTEKFLVIRGKAHFGFRHIQSDERCELVVEGGEGRIVETIPGWTHNITNVGDDELIVMLWANEIFDRQRPDTIAMKV